MFKNWSKIVLVSALVIAIAAPAVFATTARVRSLANTGDYYSDDSNVNRWLSTLPSYANQVNAELGFWNNPDNVVNGFGEASLADSRGLSWIFGTGKWGTYRVTINENQLDHAGFWMINPFYNNFMSGSASNLLGPGAAGSGTPINTWDVAGGWELGDNMALGVNLTRSRWSYKVSDDDPDNNVEIDNTYSSLGAGFSWTNNEDMVLDLLLNLGFAGGSALFGVADPATNPKLEWDSGSAFDVAGRFFWDWKDDITVPVKVEFINSDYSVKPAGGAGVAVPSGDKMSAFQFGVGVDMDVNQDHMLIFAVEFTSMSWKYSNPPSTSDAAAPDTLTELSTSVMPTLRLALESSITSWLTTRIGAARHMTKVTAKSNVAGNEIEATDGNPLFTVEQAAFEWFLGCGFNIAEWTIDMELAAETPFSIGYWLTGYSAFDGNDANEYGPVGRISAVYNY